MITDLVIFLNKDNFICIYNPLNVISYVIPGCSFCHEFENACVRRVSRLVLGKSYLLVLNRSKAYGLHGPLRDYSFTAYAKFSEKLTFLNPWNAHEWNNYRAYSRTTLRSTIERCPFCGNYVKLYFDAKHLEKGLNRVEWNFWGSFFKKLPFFHKSVLSGQYRTLP